MILPQTYVAALLITILSMVCWGSWANTQKLTRNWRFELFYYDYSFGVLVLAAIAAFTFGSLGFDGFSFLDDLMRASKRAMAYGFGAGVLFNLANMLLVAAIAVAGMSVAFPVGIGLALVIGVVGNYVVNPQGNPTLLFAGVALVVAAIVIDALAYASLAKARARAAKSGKKKGGKTWKGLALSIAAGLLMGSFYPLVELGKAGEAGLGPYAIGFIFAVGVFLSTFIFNLFFMNLPVQGDPLTIPDYFKGTGKQHLLGIAGGMIWCVGTVANFVASSTPPEVQVGPAISYAMGQGATMVSALWGILVWKEFAGADRKTHILVVLMLVLFLVGLSCISVAPIYTSR